MDNNFNFSNRGRILLLWDLQRVTMEVLMPAEQFIHCRIQCLITGWSFLISFIYGFHSIVTMSAFMELSHASWGEHIGAMSILY